MPRLIRSGRGRSQAPPDTRPETPTGVSGLPGGPAAPAEQRHGGRPAANRLGLGLPALAHPMMAPAEWAEAARPGTPLDWVAFDVARGPGARPDPLYGEALGRVRGNGVPLLGVLDAAHGKRPCDELLADAAHYLDWYRADGFYLDRAPTLHNGAAECRELVGELRVLPGGTTGARPRPVVLAPGVHPSPGYADFADQLVTFNGPWSRYRWSEVPDWTADHPPSRFVHLVHGMPALHLDTALRIARWQGAGTVCLTDRSDREGADPWAGLPGYWGTAVRRIRRQQ